MNKDEKIDILCEFLPFMQQYRRKIIVIKYGGHAMTNDELAHLFAADITLLQQCGIKPVIVHGGGPQIQEQLQERNIITEKVNGLRVTNVATLDVVEMVLSGTINKHITSAICSQGGKAIGISGRDNNLMTAEKEYGIDSNNAMIDIGFVGKVAHVDASLLRSLIEQDIVPVISPISSDISGQAYNINADSAAGMIASALQAERLLMLTDIAGVMDAAGQLLPTISHAKAQSLINDGVIKDGMVPKINCCLTAMEHHVNAATIIDGRTPHAVLLELFTKQGVGTQIIQNT